MRQAVVVCKGIRNNEIFNEVSNRDGLKDKWIALRASFAEASLDLVTMDVASASCIEPLFELHINVQRAFARRQCPSYVLLYEAPQLHPLNADSKRLATFRKIFTWDESRVSGDRWCKLLLGHRIEVPQADGFSARPLFCTMIAANKALPASCDLDLYRERVALIRWFEKNAPREVCLYGADWDLPVCQPGIAGKVFHHFCKRLLPRSLLDQGISSWRGCLPNKAEVLRASRFTIAYENVRDLPGYITEKILDAFSAGCVPIYWGASDVTRYIPSDCFIDRRFFRNNEDLFLHLKNMKEQQYRYHQDAIVNFMQGAGTQTFGVQTFARSIVATITDDLRAMGLVF